MQNIKRRFACALLLLFLLALLPLPRAFAEEEPIPEGYTGIYDRAGLEAISDLPDGNYILMADVALTDAAFTPLCDEETPFCGILDGNGHTVYGLAATEKDGASGLFACVDGGTVKNLTVSGSAEGARAGLIAAKIDRGTVQDCEVRGTVRGSYAGGVVGQARGDGVTVCACVSFADVTLFGSGGAGGVCGAAFGSQRWEESSFFGSLNAAGGTVFAGGILGETAGEIAVASCVSAGTLTVTDAEEVLLGGLIGIASGSVAVTGGESSSSLTATGCAEASLGGICGRMIAGEVRAEQCVFTGEIHGEATSLFVGGICGFAVGSDDGTAEISQCLFSGTVYADGTYARVGGIAGECLADGGVTVLCDCRADGKLIHASLPTTEPPQLGTGGIVAFNGGTGTATVTRCISLCDVRAEFEACAGTAVGLNAAYDDEAAVSVTDCYYPFGGTDHFASVLSGEELTREESYHGFDFGSVWLMDDTTQTPVLRFRVSQTASLPGDTDGSGRITMIDARLLAGYLTGNTELAPSQLARCDFDGDGAVSAEDLMWILREYENS